MACVAYSGLSASPTRAVARCGVFAAPAPSAPALTTISLTRKLDFGYRNAGGHASSNQALLVCPEPFTLVGCSCNARRRDCLGVRYSRLHDGTPVCNVSMAHPPSYMASPFDIHANCIWRGATSRLDPARATRPDRRHEASSCAAVVNASLSAWTLASINTTLEHKPWLPAGTTKMLAHHDVVMGHFEDRIVARLVSLSLASFTLGVIVTVLCGCAFVMCCPGACGCVADRVRGRDRPTRYSGDGDDEMMLGGGMRSDAPVHRVGEMRSQVNEVL